MARLNTRPERIYTHEGATAQHINPEQQLRRTVLACLLWEKSFYENGVAVADRIDNLCMKVDPEVIGNLALEARGRFNLRHVSLLLAANLARYGKGNFVGRTIADVIQRADELAEFLAIYWRHGKCPLSKQVKIGLSNAFRKFNAYQLAKYDRKGEIKMRDVLFLCHAKPKDIKQGQMWKRLINGDLETPDTWETQLSAGENKRTTFERLMREKKLGGLAFLRNLRNMAEAGVSLELVQAYGAEVNLDRVLPFRYISAARAVPAWEAAIEPMMLRSLEALPRLRGKTAIVVDNSGSMYYSKVSEHSDLTRSDAACALAVLLRGICDECVVVGFGSTPGIIPGRVGFALVDAIKRGPGGGTNTRYAINLANREGYDRIVVLTDEQSHQTIDAPEGVGYFINVATYKNGIGYGAWTHIDGFSEAVLTFIREIEDAD